MSLLTPGEISALDITQEKKYCKDKRIVYLSFPIVDRNVPDSLKATFDFLKKLDKMLAEGKNVAVHCRQGIGRAALVAASLLVLGGLDATSAFKRVSKARGYDVPETVEQREWVTNLKRAKKKQYRLSMVYNRALPNSKFEKFWILSVFPKARC